MKQTKQASALVTALLLTLAIGEASAASQLPTAVSTALTTDMTDTYDAVMTWVCGIFPVVAIGWFAFNQARKGAGKFGAK